MKKIALMFAAVAVSSSAFAAQSIQLSAGSKALISAGQETEVSCAGSSSGLSSRCTLQKTTSNGYRVYRVSVDGAQLEDYSSLENALNGIKTIKESGLCD